jgi:hypothetical protein
MKYELHPLCTLFPRLEGVEFRSLCNDIRESGLRNPIVIHDGMILDGGNRYRACVEAGIEPSFQQFDGGNLVSFVLSANLHRRHMSTGQQAAIVSSTQDWASAQPAYRPCKAGNVTGLSTVADRMAQSGASDKTQRMADKVAKSDPGLARQVAHGEISLPKAAAAITGNSSKSKLAEQEAKKEIIREMADDFNAIDELEKANKEIVSLVKIFEANDQLDSAVKEVRRLNALVTILEERNRGMMNEANEAKRLARSWKNKCEKLEREFKEAGLVDL